MNYYIYENSQYSKAMIHKGECEQCQEGQGKNPTVIRRYSKWHGPFDTLEQATRAAKATGQKNIRECKICFRTRT